MPQPRLLFVAVPLCLLLLGSSRSSSTRPGPTTSSSSTLPQARPEPTTLKFTASSISEIQAGTKTGTTRKGTRDFPGNIAIGTDGERDVDLIIINRVTKKAGELNDVDARADGAKSLGDMKKTLTKNFPGIGDDDLVTVVTFRMAKQ